MRRPERPDAPEPGLGIPEPRHRVYLGSEQSLLRGHRRKDARQGLCQRALPRAWSTDEHCVVLAGGGNLQPPFGGALADYIGKIHRGGTGRVGTRKADVCGALLHRKVPQGPGVPVQQVQHLGERAYGVHVDRGRIGRLQGRCLRQDTTPQAAVDGQLGHRQGSAHRPHPSVQAELPHNEVVPQGLEPPLPRRGYYPHGDGKVVAAAFFLHIGGSQVDNYLAARNMESAGLQGRYRTEETLLYGGIGKAYEVYSYAVRDFHLHHYREGLDAYAFCTVNLNEHTLAFFAQATANPPERHCKTEKFSKMFFNIGPKQGQFGFNLSFVRKKV